MAEIKHQKHLPFTPEQMYNLVQDIEKYPEFLPYCTGLNVLSEQERSGKRIRVAEMTIGYKMLKESFTSRVLEDEKALAIRTSLVSGPFSHLENSWSFVSDEKGGCLLQFYLTYTFSSKMFERLVGTAFDRFFNLFASSFEKRAHDIYSAPNT